MVRLLAQDKSRNEAQFATQNRKVEGSPVPAGCRKSEGKSKISSEGELIWGPRKCVSFLGIRSKQANGKAFGARQKLK